MRCRELGRSIPTRPRYIGQVHYHAPRMRRRARSPFPTPNHPRVHHPTPGHEPPTTGTKPTTPAFNSKLGHSLLSFSRVPLHIPAPRRVNALIDSNQLGPAGSCERSNWVVVISAVTAARNSPGMHETVLFLRRSW